LVEINGHDLPPLPNETWFRDSEMLSRLITQTLDPILTAFFRDVAQKNSMLDLLVKRETIQQQATEELGNRFKVYDINCIAVLLVVRNPRKRAAPMIQSIVSLISCVSGAWLTSKKRLISDRRRQQRS
jgi:hypothetical protein